MSTKQAARPLSPHLQIWRWSLTMAMSILHRASGIALALGTLMLVWMLISAATSADAYATFAHFAHSIIGQIMLFGWTGALYFHLFSGLRHLIMDAGYLLNIQNTDKASKVVIILAIALTIATWGVLKLSRGEI